MVQITPCSQVLVSGTAGQWMGIPSTLDTAQVLVVAKRLQAVQGELTSLVRKSEGLAEEERAAAAEDAAAKAAAEQAAARAAEEAAAQERSLAEAAAEQAAAEEVMSVLEQASTQTHTCTLCYHTYQHLPAWYSYPACVFAGTNRLPDVRDGKAFAQFDWE